MNICFLSYKYPGSHNSSDFVFVKQLVDAIAAKGNQCFVLSPFNVLHYRRLSKTKEQYSVGSGTVTVIRPLYLSFSRLHIGKYELSSFFHKRAIYKAFKMLSVSPDIIYGHFWNSAYEGFKYSKKNRIPLFVATGESDVARMFNFKEDVKDFAEHIRGVICVSRKNRDESIALGLTTLSKCEIFPNAVNEKLFYKRDKRTMRELLGFPQDAFIVIFVGWFNVRKGPERVAQAIMRLKGEKIHSVFVGKGDQDPSCEGILFKGPLTHDKLPLFLSASDVFVLPTLQEGCCNAVIEAMACGLPVVSSNLPFNHDVLDGSNSILINPTDVNEISHAIQKIHDDIILRNNLAAGALKRAQSLTIDKRAEAILDFIHRKV